MADCTSHWYVQIIQIRLKLPDFVNHGFQVQAADVVFT